jgi:hypothetical protein
MSPPDRLTRLTRLRRLGPVEVRRSSAIAPLDNLLLILAAGWAGLWLSGASQYAADMAGCMAFMVSVFDAAVRLYLWRTNPEMLRPQRFVLPQLPPEDDRPE